MITAITGYCIGAGLDVTSACDVRFCSKEAKFTIKEVDIGICADLGTMQRFSKVTGSESWTRELAYTGRFFDAKEALAHGYVSQVFDTPEQCQKAVMDLATQIASKSPVAINTTKKSLNYSRDHTVAEGLDHIALLNSVMLQTEDSAKAVTANFSKQIPKFAKL